jgi:hypothetical protein
MCTLQLTSENLRLGSAAALFGRSGGAPNSSLPLNEISLFIPEGDVTCPLDMYREWLEGLIFLQWQYIFSSSTAFVSFVRTASGKHAKPRKFLKMSHLEPLRLIGIQKMPRRRRKNQERARHDLKNTRHNFMTPWNIVRILLLLHESSESNFQKLTSLTHFFSSQF